MPEQNSLFSTITPIVKVAPPTSGTCPICAVSHPPQYPHDLHSLYYQMRFRQSHGRLPTCEDAMVCCEQETKELIRYVVAGENNHQDGKRNEIAK